MNVLSVSEVVRETRAGAAEIPCFDPATGAALGEVKVDFPEDVRRAIERAREAQRAWAKVSFAERRKVLGSILDQILEQADDLVDTIVRDSGKTRENAMLGEIWPVAEKLRWTLRHGERHLRPERRGSGLLAHKVASVRYEPLGVIGIIAPWNYPLQNILGPVVPALFAGNAAIVKVSEQVAWSSGRFARLVEEAFDRAGYPRALVQLLNGYAQTGRALVRGGVDKIVFTGSMSNGRSIIADSAETLTPVILELGGKDPLIVCDDADLEQALHSAMAGVFIHCGQNCLAAERLIVFDRVYDEFERRLADMTRSLRQGAPLSGETVDVSAIVSPYQLDLIERLVAEAVSEGARVLAGGKRLPGPGQFFAPTVLAGVTPSMRIAREEVFGPVALLMRVAGEEEAIALANDTAFGLGATVLTRDRARARRVLDKVVAGGVSINEFGLTYMAQDLPFGGARGSGFGRLNGPEGLRAMCNVKSVLEDRFPVPLPPAKLYPVGDGDYARAKAVIRTIYSRSWSNKLSSAADAVRLMLRRR